MAKACADSSQYSVITAGIAVNSMNSVKNAITIFVYRKRIV